MKKAKNKKKKEIPAPKYKYGQHVLKSSEGGPGVATLKSVFKNKQALATQGIQVMFHSSCHIGQTAFIIFAATKKAMDTAAEVLADYGYVDSKAYVLRYMDRV